MTSTINNPTIVLVDDDPNLLFSLKEFFRHAEYTVHTARNGTEALQQIFSVRPDLVVCDLNMPSPNGFEVQRFLKKHLETESTPFIFLTASSAKADILHGYELGADEYVTKPFDPDVLLAKINRLIVRARREAQEKLLVPGTAAVGEVNPLKEQIRAITNLSDSMTAQGSNHQMIRMALIQILNSVDAQAVELWWANRKSGQLEFHSGFIIQHSLEEYQLGKKIEPLQVSCRQMLIGDLHEDAWGIPIWETGKQKGFLWIYNSSSDLEVRGSTSLKTLVDFVAKVMKKEGTPASLDLLQNKDDYVFELLEGLTYALDLRDHETGNHSLRVVDLMLSLARKYGFSGTRLEDVRIGAMAHDLGKIGVPDSILTKPGPLSEEEWKVMHMHPYYAIELLSRFDILASALDIPLYHHERWDGKGYPFGLSGSQIPLSAQLFGIVDTWDALTNDRPYRRAMHAPEAVQILLAERGKGFQPEIVGGFLELLKEKRIL